MNDSVVFFYFRYVLVNWIDKSRVVLLEQINVLRHQVFVAQNSHKSSLFLCDLVIHFIDVRFLFQYAVGLGLRGCHSSVRLGRSRSARLITGLEITAGQRTMSGQNWVLTGQIFGWPDMLSGHLPTR